MTSRSQDFESLLSCGFMDEKGPTAAAAARFIESLAVASGVVSAGKRGPGNEPLYAPNGLPNTLAAQVAVLQVTHPFAPFPCLYTCIQSITITFIAETARGDV